MPTLTRTAPSATNTNKKENNASQTRAASQSSALSDNRPGTLAQMKVVEAMSEGPRAQKTAQLQALMPNNSPVQLAADEEEVQMKAAPIQKKENNTGLPDNLKSGVESLSGVSMNDVKVHPNSDQPAQMQAHAFAQGTDIHVAPGQEQHLPHEAWHVVQQKQGRVKPTTQLKGQIPVNDDKGLEHEADVMGAKALTVETSRQNTVQKQSSTETNVLQPVIQRNIGDIDKDEAVDEAQGTAEQAIGIAKLSAGNDKSLFNALGDNNEKGDITGDIKENATTGSAQGEAHVADSVANVTGTLLQGYKTFQSWENMKETDDPIAKADTALQGTKFVYNTAQTVMTTAKSTEIAGLMPGISSGLNLLESGLALMKDKRAQDAIKKIKSEVDLKPDEQKLLSEYGRRVHWKMIEDGTEALWSVAELIGLAFPGFNAGISFLHSGANLLKSGVKMYLSYGAGKRDKAASRLKVGEGSDGITDKEKARLSQTGDLVKNAGKSHIDFVRLLRLLEEETRLTEAVNASGDSGDKAKLTSISKELNQKILKYNKLFGTWTGGKDITRNDIAIAKGHFLNLIKSLKDDVLKVQGRWARFQHSLPGVHLQRKIDAKPLFESLFGIQNNIDPTDLEILQAAENDGTGAGGYIDTKLGETVARAKDFSVKDVSKEKLTSSLVETLAKDPLNFYKTFHNLDAKIFEGEEIPNTATFKTGLTKYFAKIDPF